MLNIFLNGVDEVYKACVACVCKSIKIRLIRLFFIRVLSLFDTLSVGPYDMRHIIPFTQLMYTNECILDTLSYLNTQTVCV